MRLDRRACARVERRIQAYLDGGESLRWGETEHLAACPRCRRLLAGYTSFRGGLARAVSELVPKGEPDWEAVFARADGAASVRSGRYRAGGRGERGVGTRSFPRRAPLLVAAAAVCLLTLAGILTYNQLSYRSAQRFVREDTTRFVDAMLASPLDQVSGVIADEWGGGPTSGGAE